MFQKIKKIIDELIQINKLKTQNNVKNSKVKICPSCTSKLEPLTEQLEWLMPQKYLCKKCNYLGTAYFEQ